MAILYDTKSKSRETIEGCDEIAEVGSIDKLDAQISLMGMQKPIFQKECRLSAFSNSLYPFEQVHVSILHSAKDEVRVAQFC